MRKLTSVALVVAGLGIAIQIYLGGDIPEYPTVPPGGLIMIGAALIAAFVPWRLR